MLSYTNNKSFLLFFLRLEEEQLDFCFQFLRWYWTVKTWLKTSQTEKLKVMQAVLEELEKKLDEMLWVSENEQTLIEKMP